MKLDKLNILYILCELRDELSAGACKEIRGICDHLKLKLGVPSSGHICALLAKYWVNWEHYSGCINFPVPSPEGDSRTPMDIYVTAHKYKGEYGKLRISLLNYLIDVISKEVMEESYPC